MLPKVYKTSHPDSPWLVVYSDPTQRNAKGQPKRIQKWFGDEEKARRHHRTLMNAAAAVGTAGLAMDARERADFYGGRMVLDQAGHTGTSVTEALRTFVKSAPAAARAETPIAPLYELFVAAKQVEDNAADRTVGNLKARVKAWLVREEIVTLGDITEEKLLALKQRKSVSATTKINDMAAVSSFLSWLKERRLRGVNELLDMARPKSDLREPQVLQPDQVRALLDAALEMGGGRLVRYFALQLLAGLRPGEAARVSPEQIRLNAKPPFVRVLRGKKRNRPRPAPVLKNFRAWWDAGVWPEQSEAQKKAGVPAPLWDDDRDRRLFDSIRERAGLVRFEKVAGPGGWMKRDRRTNNHWQGDICRHTWISVRMQQTKDEARVAYEAGTSRDMIHAHYLDLVDDAQVRAIEGIRPRKAKLTRAAAPAERAA